MHKPNLCTPCNNLYVQYINQHVNTDILTPPRALETSIPLCDIDTNVSMSPVSAALII